MAQPYVKSIVVSDSVGSKTTGKQNDLVTITLKLSESIFLTKEGVPAAINGSSVRPLFWVGNGNLLQEVAFIGYKASAKTLTYTAVLPQVNSADLKISLQSIDITGYSLKNAKRQDFVINPSIKPFAKYIFDITPPSFLQPEVTALPINENARAGFVYAPIVAGASTYRLTGADASLLSINKRGQVSIKKSADYEAKSDYSFGVIATDAAGNSSVQNIKLPVKDVNEPIKLAAGVKGNGSLTFVKGTIDPGNITADFADPERAALTFSLIRGNLPKGLGISPSGAITGTASFDTAGTGSFTVSVTDGIRALNRTYSYKTLTKPVINSLQISDSVGNSKAGKVGDVITLALNFSESIATSAPITNTNIIPTFAVGKSALTGVSFSSASNNSIFYTATLQADTPDARSITLTNLTFANNFSLTGASSQSVFVFEPKKLVSGAYAIDKVVPRITSAGLATVKENVSAGSVVYSATTSKDATPITYSLSGLDASLFSINSSNGKVSINARPNYESAKNIYNFSVNAVDGAGNIAVAKPVTLRVKDLPEAPTYVGTFPAQKVTAYLNQPFNLFNNNSPLISVNDEDVASTKITLKLTPYSGVIGGLTPTGKSIIKSGQVYTLNGTVAQINGVLAGMTFTPNEFSGPNPLPDGFVRGKATISYSLTDNNKRRVPVKGVYEFSVAYTPEVIAVSIADAPGHVVGPSSAGAAGERVKVTISLSELVTISGAQSLTSTNFLPVFKHMVNGTVVTLTPIDAVTLNGKQISFEALLPASVSSSNILLTNLSLSNVTLTGQSSTRAMGNFRNLNIPTNYLLDNEPPVFTSPSTANINENVPAATEVMTASATDNSSLTYSLADTDATNFEINASTGVIKIKASPDHEVKSVYSFNVIATDLLGNSSSQRVTVNVADLNEPVVLRNPAQTTITQVVSLNQTYSLNLNTLFKDPEGSAISYTSTSLPVGLTLNSGTLSGTPSSASTYTFTVSSNDGDANAGVEDAKQVFVMTVSNDPVADAVTITDGVGDSLHGKANDSVTIKVKLSQLLTTPSGVVIDINSVVPKFKTSVMNGLDVPITLTSVSDGVEDSKTVLTYQATLPAGINSDNLVFTQLSLSNITLTGSSGRTLVGSQMYSILTNYALDNTVPSSLPGPASSVSFLPSQDTGFSSIDRITNQSSVNVIITPTAALTLGSDILQVSADNGSTWFSMNKGAGNSYTSAQVVLQSGANQAIRARVIDLAGNITEAPLNDGAYTLDTTAPSPLPSVTTLTLSADTGLSTTDKITSVAAQNITLNLGSAFTVAAGERFEISADGTNWIAAAPANPGNTIYTAAGVTLQSGAHTLAARVIDTAGNISNVVLTDSQKNYLLDTTPPSAISGTVSVSFPTSDDSGVSSTDRLTKISAVQVILNLQNPLTLAADEILQVSADGGTNWVATAVSGVNNNIYQTSAAAVTLRAGAGTITARIIDTAGNATAVTLNQGDYVLDNTAPTISSANSWNVAENTQTVASLVATDNRSTAAGALTWSIVGGSDAALFSIGSASGVLSWASPNGRDFDISRSAANTSVYDLTVRATDQAGNTTNQNLSVTVTNVNESPEISGTISTQQVVVGIDTPITQNFSVADQDNDSLTLTITTTNGTLTGIADANPTLAGIQVTGSASTINTALRNALKFNPSVTGVATLSMSVSDGSLVASSQTHTFNAVDRVAIDSSDLYVNATDTGVVITATYNFVSGNILKVVNHANVEGMPITLDSNDASSRSKTITISKSILGNGTTLDGDYNFSVKYYANPNATGTPIDSNTLVAKVDTVSPTLTLTKNSAINDGATSAEAQASLYTIQLSESGKASVVFTRASSSVTKTIDVADTSAKSIVLSADDIATLGDGTINVTATATDLAGNAATATTSSFNLDTVAPSIGAITVAANGDDFLNATETSIAFDVAVSGLPDGGKLQLRLAGTSLSDVTIPASATSVSVTANKSSINAGAEGSYSFTAFVTDSAGNTSSLSAPKVITVDNTAPLPRSTLLAAGFTASDQAKPVNELLAGDKVIYTIDLGEPLSNLIFLPTNTVTNVMTIGTSAVNASFLQPGTGNSIQLVHTIVAGENGVITLNLANLKTSLNSANIKDIAGNVLSLGAGFSFSQAATTLVADTTAPTPMTISSSSFSSTISGVTQKAIGSGSTIAVNPSGSNETLTLTMNSAVASGERLQWSSNAGASWADANVASTVASITSDFSGTESVSLRLIDVAGNSTATGGINLTVDTTAPTLTNAFLVGDKLTLAFNENLNTTVGQLPTTSDFSFTNGGTLAATALTVTGNNVILTLNKSFAANETIPTINYTNTANDVTDIQDTAGNEAGTFSARTVENRTTDLSATALSGAEVNNLSVTSNIVLDINNGSAGATHNLANGTITITDKGGTGSGGTGFRGENTTNTIVLTLSTTGGVTTVTTSVGGTALPNVNSSVSISNGKLIINPGVDFDFANNYEVTASAGIINTRFADNTSITSLALSNPIRFSTVTPDASAGASGALSKVMDNSGNLVDSYRWVDLEGRGSVEPATIVSIDASTQKFAFVWTDYNSAASVTNTFTNVSTKDFNVQLNNLGTTDLFYLDNNGVISNTMDWTQFSSAPPFFVNAHGNDAPKNTNAYFFWNPFTGQLANNTYFNLEAADTGWAGITISQITLGNLLNKNMVLAG